MLWDTFACVYMASIKVIKEYFRIDFIHFVVVLFDVVRSLCVPDLYSSVFYDRICVCEKKVSGSFALTSLLLLFCVLAK